jgi:hypothetical protein
LIKKSYIFQLIINSRNEKKQPYVHRLVAQMFIGPTPEPHAIVRRSDPISNDVSTLTWAPKNSQKLRGKEKSNKRGMGKPITMSQYESKSDSYVEYFTWFRLVDAVEELKLDPSAKANISTACKTGKIAYRYKWTYATGNIDYEIWNEQQTLGCETIAVSTMGRVKCATNRIGFGDTDQEGFMVYRLKKAKQKSKEKSKKKSKQNCIPGDNKEVLLNSNYNDSGEIPICDIRGVIRNDSVEDNASNTDLQSLGICDISQVLAYKEDSNLSSRFPIACSPVRALAHTDVIANTMLKMRHYMKRQKEKLTVPFGE